MGTYARFGYERKVISSSSGKQFKQRKNTSAFKYSSVLNRLTLMLGDISTASLHCYKRLNFPT